MKNLLWSLVLVAFTSGCVSVDLGQLFRPELTEQTVQEAEGFTRHKILIVDLNGMISSEPAGAFSPVAKASPDHVTAVLKRAEADSRIRAVILRVDSPGGGVTASDMIFKELLSYKQRTGVPVLCSVLGVGASGGYYLACAGDEIYAHPTSIVGSIGVLARIPMLKELADKVGYDEVIVKSGDKKDMGHPLVALSEEERQVIQDIVDDSYQRFLETVVAQRDDFATTEQLKPWADGRVFTARQALEAGLVDGVAYLPEVIERAKTLAGIDDAEVMMYAFREDPNATIYTVHSGQQVPSLNMVNLDFGELTRPRASVMYLWWPGR